MFSKLSLLLLLISSNLVLAQWSTDPSVNNTLCSNSSSQAYPSITSDGNGGAIITWIDLRNGSTNWDIYAQKINSNGVLQWTTDGAAICNATGNQEFPQILADVNGGAIIVWVDWRSGTSAIYAQKINSSGIAQWTSDGVAICTGSGGRQSPLLVSDGNGGAIITWIDSRSGTGDNVYSQRVDNSGTIKWTANGVLLCNASGNQDFPVIASDDKGGAIIAWYDSRNGTSNEDIYAQRIDSSGSLLWNTNGVAICSASNSQDLPSIVKDNYGGAIITWEDARNGSTNYDIYAQRIDSSGAVQWTTDGVAVCSATGSQGNPYIVSDSKSGAIITWFDLRNGSTNYDIYAQRIDSSGVVQWTADGVAICNALGDQYYPDIVTDGNGGAIIGWYDKRNASNYDIYAQRIDSSGNVKWTTDGVAVCTASGNQQYFTNEYNIITSNGSNGAIITWYDSRNGSSNLDIYAQEVGATGVLPVELTTFTATSLRDKVELQWNTATEVNNYGFEVQRSEVSSQKSEGGSQSSIDNRQWEKVGFVKGSGNSNSTKNYSFVDDNPLSGTSEYRLKQIDNNGNFKYSQTVTVNSLPANFALYQNYPNPFNPTTTIQYAIPKVEHVTLKVYDELGQEVSTLVDENKEAGQYRVNFNGSSLASGIYIYKMNAGSFTEVKKLMLLK